VERCIRVKKYRYLYGSNKVFSKWENQYSQRKVVNYYNRVGSEDYGFLGYNNNTQYIPQLEYMVA
jgi:hypothetical protein